MNATKMRDKIDQLLDSITEQERGEGYADGCQDGRNECYETLVDALKERVEDGGSPQFLAGFLAAVETLRDAGVAGPTREAIEHNSLPALAA